MTIDFETLVQHPGYVSGNWYAIKRGTAATNVAQVADVLCAMPIFIAKRTTLSSLGVRVGTGAASTNVKLGIYANTGGRPGALIAQGTGAASCATSSTDAVVTFSSNPVLDVGIYWLASIFNGTPSIQSCSSNDQVIPSLIGSSTLSIVVAGSGMVVAVTGVATYAGGFPDPFGTPTDRAAATALVAYKIA